MVIKGIDIIILEKTFTGTEYRFLGRTNNTFTISFYKNDDMLFYPMDPRINATFNKVDMAKEALTYAELMEYLDED